MEIRKCRPDDAQRVSAIYNHYITHSATTFEEHPLSPTSMAERIHQTTKSYPWLVLETADEQIVAYAYAKEWSVRSAYRYTVEVSVYVDNTQSGKGYGSLLYKELLSTLSTLGFRSAIATITLPNPASIGFHESFGFEKVSHFKATGFKFDRWIDVGHWQVQLKVR